MLYEDILIITIPIHHTSRKNENTATNQGLIKMEKNKEYLEDLELRKWWYNHY